MHFEIICLAMLWMNISIMGQQNKKSRRENAEETQTGEVIIDGKKILVATK